MIRWFDIFSNEFLKFLLFEIGGAKLLEGGWHGNWWDYSHWGPLLGILSSMKCLGGKALIIFSEAFHIECKSEVMKKIDIKKTGVLYLAVLCMYFFVGFLSRCQQFRSYNATKNRASTSFTHSVFNPNFQLCTQGNNNPKLRSQTTKTVFDCFLYMWMFD